LKRHILVKGCGKASADDNTKRETPSPKIEDSKTH
jgi:hypothetical protein